MKFENLRILAWKSYKCEILHKINLVLEHVKSWTFQIIHNLKDRIFFHGKKDGILSQAGNHGPILVQVGPKFLKIFRSGSGLVLNFCGSVRSGTNRFWSIDPIWIETESSWKRTFIKLIGHERERSWENLASTFELNDRPLWTYNLSQCQKEALP